MTARAALLLIRGEHEASFDEFERAIERLLHMGDHERAAAALLRLLQSMITAGTRPARRIEAGERYIGRVDPCRAGAARRADPPRLELRVRLRLRPGGGARLQAALALPGPPQARPILSVYAAVVQAPTTSARRPGRLEEAVRSLDEAIAELERQEERRRARRSCRTPGCSGSTSSTTSGLTRRPRPRSARTIDAAARRGMARTHRRVVAWIWSVALAGLGRWDDLERELAPPVRSPGQREPTSYSYRYRAVAAALAAVAGRRRRRGGPRGGGARGDARPSGSRSTTPWCSATSRGRPRRGPSTELGLDWPPTPGGIGARDRERPGASRAHSCTWPQRDARPAGDAALAEALRLTERWSFGALWTDRERAAGPGPLLSRRARQRVSARRALRRGSPPPAAPRSSASASSSPSPRPRRCGRSSPRSPGTRPTSRPPRSSGCCATGTPRSAPPPARPGRASTLGHGRRSAPHARPLLRDARRRPRPGVRLRAPEVARAARRAARRPRAGAPRAARRVAVAADCRPERASAGAPRRPPRPAPRARARARGERAGVADRRRRRDRCGSSLDERGRVGRHALPRPRAGADRRPRRRGDRAASSGPRRSTPGRSCRMAVRRLGRAGPPGARGAPSRGRSSGWRRRWRSAGRLHEAIRRYRRLVSLEPEREAWHRALMRCFATAGERARRFASSTPAGRSCGASRAWRPSPETRPSTARSWPPDGRVTPAERPRVGAWRGHLRPKGDRHAARPDLHRALRLAPLSSPALPLSRLPADGRALHRGARRHAARWCRSRSSRNPRRPRLRRDRAPAQRPPGQHPRGLRRGARPATGSGWATTPSSSTSRTTPASTSGREIWGWPKKLAEVSLPPRTPTRSGRSSAAAAPTWSGPA